MDQAGDPARESEALRRRIATLKAAILRINARFDLHTALNEVVDSARALTGARRGVIASVDQAGAPRDFVCSGPTPQERQELLA